MPHQTSFWEACWNKSLKSTSLEATFAFRGFKGLKEVKATSQCRQNWCSPWMGSQNRDTFTGNSPLTSWMRREICGVWHLLLWSRKWNGRVHIHQFDWNFPGMCDLWWHSSRKKQVRGNADLRVLFTNFPHKANFYYFFFFSLAVLRIKPRALSMLGKHSTTGHTLALRLSLSV